MAYFSNYQCFSYTELQTVFELRTDSKKLQGKKRSFWPKSRGWPPQLNFLARILLFSYTSVQVLTWALIQNFWNSVEVNYYYLSLLISNFPMSLLIIPVRPQSSTIVSCDENHIRSYLKSVGLQLLNPWTLIEPLQFRISNRKFWIGVP